MLSQLVCRCLLLLLNIDCDYNMLQAAAQQPPSLHQYKTLQQRVENMERAHKNQTGQLQETIDILQKEKVRQLSQERCCNYIPHNHTKS